MEKIIPAKLAAGDEIRVIAPARGIKIIGQMCIRDRLLTIPVGGTGKIVDNGLLIQI